MNTRMRCPACKLSAKFELPVHISSKSAVTCPLCDARLRWRRDWKRGIAMAAVCAGIAYTLGYFLFHHPRNFGFLIEGAMIGLFIGLRTLVRQQE